MNELMVLGELFITAISKCILMGVSFGRPDDLFFVPPVSIAHLHLEGEIGNAAVEGRARGK